MRFLGQTFNINIKYLNGVISLGINDLKQTI